ncbi:hypothetical protein BHM03_00000175 [Ensete ventricosum]|nr:hypothetical protein BHM03_00000175 [Ensete ventricosum]
MGEEKRHIGSKRGGRRRIARGMGGGEGFGSKRSLTAPSSIRLVRSSSPRCLPSIGEGDEHERQQIKSWTKAVAALFVARVLHRLQRDKEHRNPVAVIAFFPAHPRADRTLPTDDDARLCGGRGASYRLRHSFYPRRVLVDSSSLIRRGQTQTSNVDIVIELSPLFLLLLRSTTRFCIGVRSFGTMSMSACGLLCVCSVSAYLNIAMTGDTYVEEALDPCEDKDEQNTDPPWSLLIPLTEEKQRFHDHGYSLLRASWGTLLVDGWPAPAASECTGSPPAPPRAASGAGTPGSASRRWPRRSRTPDPSSLRSLRTRGCSLRPLFDVAEAPAVDHQRASVRCTTLHKRKRKRKRKSNLQHFANVACAKHLVDHDKLVGFIGREEGSKDAVLGASPPEKLARSTRRVATHFTGQQKKKTGYILADMEFGTVRLDGDASTYLSLKPKVIDDLNTRRKQ